MTESALSSRGPRGERAADRPPAELPPPARTLASRIGDTPIIPLPGAPEGVELLGKAEWFNPGGSVKDRPAWAMVRAALARGDLPSRRLLDASSGNTAIAYAMLGAAVGFGVTICLPANASRARKRTLRAYGAETVETDPLEGSDGAIRRARRLAERRPGEYWYADQYSNPANWRAHRDTTAPEVWNQTGGRITHLVAGLGTTGTLVGTARGLRVRKESVRTVAVQPASGLHGIEGLKHLETAEVPGIWDPEAADEHLFVSTEEAQEGARRLAREAGLFVGVSSGAAWTAARRVTGRLERGTVVAVLPDGGERYLNEEWGDE